MIAAIAILGKSVSVESLKSLVGTTDRGLSIRQLRNALTTCGFNVSALFYDKSRIEAMPVPSCLICDQGHWIFILSRMGNKFEVYDPLVGWSWQSFPRLRRRVNGLGVDFSDYWETQTTVVPESDKVADETLRKGLLGSFRGRSLWLALSIFILSQIVVLFTPLVAMRSANEAFNGISGNLITLAAVAFGFLSVANIIMTLIGDLLYNKLRYAAEDHAGRLILSALEEKSFEWFERNPGVVLQEKIGSLHILIDFYLSAFRSLSTLVVSLVAGIAVLLIISPALILPGLAALVISIIVDLLLERRQHNYISSHVGTSQNYQRFVLDTLSQFPLFLRHEATGAIKRRHRVLTRQTGAMHARLESLQSWRGGIITMTKSAENLFFVLIAASFMGAGQFAIGGFVALGAYKDLLSGALGSLFQQAMKYRSLAVHKMQAATLFDPSASTTRESHPITEGRIEFRDVSFRYGSFDEFILEKVTFRIEAGEFVLLRGPSGLGKSTVAKLLLGQLAPAHGRAIVDDRDAGGGITGVASIFQSDPLIQGTLRENLTLFDRTVAEELIWAALEAARLDAFVLGLPMKLDTQIGEGLGGLSGGQKQRLLLARAIILKPTILVLDEATAALDPHTEAEIFQKLRTLGCTIFAIAHRPEVAQFADRVFEIADRQIMEVHMRDPCSERRGSKARS